MISDLANSTRDYINITLPQNGRMGMRHSRNGLACVLIGTGLAIMSISAAKADSGYMTGNTLLSACTMGPASLCLGYLEGIADAMAPTNSVNGYRACVPVQATAGQLRDIIVQYLYRNAAQRHFAAIGLVANAFEESFPCR